MKIKAQRVLKPWIHIETGNWYSEYQCPYCSENLVINADADKGSIMDYNECPSCKEPVGTR